MASSERARRLGQRFIMLDSFFVVAGFNVVFPMIGLHFVDQLGWAAAIVGLALGLRQLSQQGLGLLGGSLADRFGAKPLIVGGMLLRAAGFATLAVAHHPGLLIVSCIISGLGGTLFEPSRSALIIKLTRNDERNRFYSILMMMDSAASVMGAWFGTYLLAFDFFWVGMCGCAVFVLVALLNAILLPSYRVAARRTDASVAIKKVLADKVYLTLVLTFTGYYILIVQIMLLLPVTIKQLAGHAEAVSWMYFLETALSLTLVYPLARVGERYLRLETRVMAGIALMTVSLGLMAWVHHLIPAFVILSLFFLGSLITEPAREVLMSRLAKPEARASYMGMGRIGLALGGLIGYTGGGFLRDVAQHTGMPMLPWLGLAAVGVLTLAGLHRQFLPHRQVLAVA